MGTNKSKNNSQGVSVKTNLYWNTLVRIPVQVLNFAISIVVARILMPRDFGILGIAMMLIGYANIFTNFGFNQAIVQKRIVDKKTLDSIFTFDLMISLLIAAGFFFSAGFIAEFFKTPECEKAVRVLSSVFLLTSFSALPHAILRRDMNFKAVSLLDVSQSVMMSVFTLILAMKGWGYWALVYGQIIPLSLVTLAYCFKARWIPGIYYNNSLMKPVYNFGIWNFLSSQIGFISQHIDKFFIGRWLGATNLGFYDKAMSIGTVPPNSIFMNINAVMFSAFSRYRESKGDLKEYFKKSLVLSALMIFPIYVGLIVVAPYFVYALLGEKWNPMILPFQFILFGLLFKSFGGLSQSLNVGAGKYRTHTLRRLVSLGIFSVGCMCAVPFGISGIAISFAVFSLSEIFLLMDLSRNILCLKWQDLVSAVLPAIVSSTILLLTTVGASLFILRNYTVVNMIILIVLGAFSYVVYLFFDRSHVVVELKSSLLADIFKPLLRTKNGTDQNN